MITRKLRNWYLVILRLFLVGEITTLRIVLVHPVFHMRTS